MKFWKAILTTVLISVNAIMAFGETGIAEGVYERKSHEVTYKVKNEKNDDHEIDGICPEVIILSLDSKNQLEVKRNLGAIKEDGLYEMYQSEMTPFLRNSNAQPTLKDGNMKIEFSINFKTRMGVQLDEAEITTGMEPDGEIQESFSLSFRKDKKSLQFVNHFLEIRNKSKIEEVVHVCKYAKLSKNEFVIKPD
jgi:hypothetical protein